MMESQTVIKGSFFLEVFKARRIAIVCAVAVATLAIGVFHAPDGPVLLGCGGAVAILIFRDYLTGNLKKK